MFAAGLSWLIHFSTRKYFHGTNLFRLKIISVMHVLMFTQIRGYFANLWMIEKNQYIKEHDVPWKSVRVVKLSCRTAVKLE